VLATHLIGSAEYWVLELAGGRDVQRDRLSDFCATGTGAELAARYERWLAADFSLLSILLQFYRLSNSHGGPVNKKRNKRAVPVQ